MTVPTISNLPTVPATSDPNFETEAPALFNHIKNTFVSEMNSAISFINSSTFDATVEFKNANFTAARNFLYMIDTSSGGVSVTLPANPSTGDQLLLMDQKRTFATNNLTIGRNSQNINGAASDVVSKSTGALIRCIFQASYGWTVDLYEGEWESGTNAGDLVYTGGNVGIGTSAPGAKLSISDTTQADENLHYSLTLNGDDAGTVGESTQIFMSAMTSSLRGSVIASELMDSGNSHDLIFKTNSASALPTEKMRITGDGEVELPKLAGRSYLLPSVTSVNPNLVTGTNFNNVPVQVGDEITFYNNQVRTVTAVTNTQLTVDQNWTTSFAATSATGKAGIGFNTKDIERMRITAAGKVGIGTSSPDSILEIVNQDPILTIRDTETSAGSVDAKLRLAETNASDTLGNYWDMKYSQNILKFAQNETERMVIDSSGRVGIGTSSPSSPLHVKAANNIIMSLQSSDATVGNLYFNFRNDDGDEKGWVGYGSSTTDDFGIFNNESRDLNLGTSGTTRLQIKSAGDVEVKTGNLVIGTAGKGIDFSATSGTGTSELLTDYEEGTWSPVVADASSGGNTATGNFSGTYTKVGRIVTVHGYVINVNTTGLTSTNDLFIRGLPFNNRDTIARYGTVRVQAVNFSGYCVVQLGGNANFFTILENISGSTNDVITVADLTSGTADILFSLTYEA